MYSHSVDVLPPITATVSASVLVTQRVSAPVDVFFARDQKETKHGIPTDRSISYVHQHFIAEYPYIPF